MRKVFITGSSGLLGKYLVPFFIESDKFEVHCPSSSQFNITNPSPTLSSYYDIVINLAGYSNVGEAEKDISKAIEINTYGVDWLTRIPFNTQVFHISTDYVYSGDTPLSRETDLLEPFNNYGKSKALGDMRLLASCLSNIHIIRTSFKPIRWPHTVAFDDVYTNADTVDVISKLIFRFITDHNQAGGIYNIGTEPKTIFELAKKNNPLVVKSLLMDGGISYLKPQLTMDLSKWKSCK